MGSPLVSIITPTFERSAFLPLLTECVLAQELTDFEWIVLDDSPEPSAFMQRASDPRVVYWHDATRRPVGTKRNMLIDRARGSIIAHFDDDDYYARNYLSRMVKAMSQRQAGVVKLFGFFLFSRVYKTFGYWNLTKKSGRHMVWSREPMTFTTLHESNNAFLEHNHLGYGFSYVFEKNVWEFAGFPELEWREDVPFIQRALGRYRVAGIQDKPCTCIHVLHERNTSLCFPQYLIPNFVIDKLFPGARQHLGL